MNSMQGFWIAMARLGGGWFHSEWWRYWDCGAPLEFVYAPLVPCLERMGSRGSRNSCRRWLQTVSGLIYCLGPVTLFVMAWLLTRAPGYAFAAAAALSLLAVAVFLAPMLSLAPAFLDARRLYLMVVWDETPHMAALAMLRL